MRGVRFQTHPSVTIAESDDDTSSFITADSGDQFEVNKSISSEVWDEVLLDTKEKPNNSSASAPDIVLFISAGSSQVKSFDCIDKCSPIEYHKVEVNTVQLPHHLKGRLLLSDLQAFIVDLRTALESTNSIIFPISILSSCYYRSKRCQLILDAIKKHNSFIVMKGIEWQATALDPNDTTSHAPGVISINLRAASIKIEMKRINSAVKKI